MCASLQLRPVCSILLIYAASQSTVVNCEDFVQIFYEHP